MKQKLDVPKIAVDIENWAYLKIDPKVSSCAINNSILLKNHTPFWN